MNLGFLATNRIDRKILKATLIAVLVCGLTPAPGVRANAAADDWDEVFDTARAVLSKLPDAGRIQATIKDSAMRESVLRAYSELKACAKINRDQPRAVKQGALAAFERAFKSVKTEAERTDYKTCSAKCRAEGAKCEQDCGSARKKLCDCNLTEFGLFVTQCVFG